EDIDYSKIPIETRWSDKAWKARQSAYLEPLTEKGFSAAKPSVKQASGETILKFVEYGNPNEVVQGLIVCLSQKSPKIVLGAASALNSIFKEFGSPVADPIPALQSLKPLFGHTDRNVRSQATEISVSISSFEAPHAIIDITGHSFSVVLPPRFLESNHPKLAKVGLAFKQKHEFLEVFSEDIKLDIPPEIIEGCTPPQFSTKERKYKGNFAQCEVALNGIAEQFTSTIDGLKSKPQFNLQNGFDSYFN
ncbi:hypothetical protein FF38_01473, partial [Lucilia cuprina]